MGFDCSLHLVDEVALRRHLVPRLLAETDDGLEATAFDRQTRDAAERVSRVRRKLRGRDGESAARELCELAILFNSCTMPFASTRRVALSFWSDLHPELDEFPAEYLDRSLEWLFEGLVDRFPLLKGEFLCGFDGNGATGVFVPAARVPQLARWVSRELDRLDPGERSDLALLEQVLGVAAARGLGYWEDTDLEADDRVTLESDWLRPVTSAVLPGVTRTQLSVPDLATLAHDGSAVLLTDERRRMAMILGIGTTPIVETRLEQAIVGGARSRSGTWALLSRLDSPETGCELALLRPGERWLQPFSPPVRHGSAVMRVGWLGEQPVLSPSTHGTGPVTIVVDGEVRPVNGLPEAYRRGYRITRTGANGVVRTAARDLLLYDGQAYSLDGETCMKVAHLDLQGSDLLTSAPAGEDGFFTLSDRCLYEVHPGGSPVRHLASVDNIMAISEGPPGWLLLKEGQNSRNDIGLAYRPGDASCRSISPDLIPDKVPDRSYMHWFQSVHWSPAADAVVVCMKGHIWMLPWRLVHANPPPTLRLKTERLRVLLESDDPGWPRLSPCYRAAVEDTLDAAWGLRRGDDYARRRQEHLPARAVKVSCRITCDGSVVDIEMESCRDPYYDSIALEIMSTPHLLRPLPEEFGQGVRVSASFGATGRRSRSAKPKS